MPKAHPLQVLQSRLNVSPRKHYDQEDNARGFATDMQLTQEELISTSTYNVTCGLKDSDAVALWKMKGLKLPAEYDQLNMLILGQTRAKLTDDNKSYIVCNTLLKGRRVVFQN